MVAKTGNIKKTSRGMRKDVRRMKQESRKMGVSISELKKKGALTKSAQSEKRSLTI